MRGQTKASGRIGVVGLGAMGAGMAERLVERGFTVAGHDRRPEALAALAARGGLGEPTPAAAAAGASALIVIVATAPQAEEVLFGPDGAVAALDDGATVMLSSTVPPDYARDLEGRLTAAGHPLLDAPVSGGSARAATGELTIMASGSAGAFAACDKALTALAAKVYRLGGAAGIASTVKMVNQLLAGVHIAAAAEAMALGTRAGADPRALYEVISNSAGASWMFNNRVPHMLDGDYRPLSALDIFVKDLGIVLDAGRSLRFPLPLSAAAHQLFLMGAAAGLGQEDDAGVVRVFERLAGISVTRPRDKG